MTDMTDITYDQYPDPTQTARVRALLASRVAETASGELLATALRRLQEADGISPAEMAARLGTDAAGMDRLALCRMPRADRFAEDTATIADYCSCAVAALLTLVRRADVLATFAEPVPALSSVTATVAAGSRQTSEWGVGALVAARDADDENEENPADA